MLLGDRERETARGDRWLTILYGQDSFSIVGGVVPLH